ncbi:unnamed protein product [Microthlaspi erraticum]|uniref:Uncharacterized protein n=1 Tax=Microthlaspi erraticum TaxID=1685480 RepID=A0A6D2LCB1_9BRAS|nr:unnamed protein product [Microthlaspi erraticum]
MVKYKNSNLYNLPTSPPGVRGLGGDGGPGDGGLGDGGLGGDGLGDGPGGDGLGDGGLGGDGLGGDGGGVGGLGGGTLETIVIKMKLKRKTDSIDDIFIFLCYDLTDER